MNKQKIVEELDNFWYYYRVHVIVALFILAAGLYIFFTGSETKEAAMNVVITGNKPKAEQQENLQQAATKTILEDDTDGIIKMNFWGAPDGLANGKHGGLQQKLMAMVAAADIDAFILDRASFELYAKQGTFLKLDGLKSDIPERYEFLQAKRKDKDQQKHAYGILLNGNQRLKKAGYHPENKVLAIAGNTKHQQQSMQLVKWLTRQNHP